MRARIAVAALIASAAAFTGAPAADAATDSLDDIAAKYDLVREADLPDGYELDSARRETGSSPPYFEVVGACSRVNTSVVFTGGDATVARATFEKGGTGGRIGGQGVETLFTFDDEGDAEEYFRRFQKEFDDLVKCRLMTDALGNIGTYSTLSVGKVGDERTALTFDPRADRLTRLGLVRNDEHVVYLALYDETATDAEFAALLKQAEKRSR